LKNFIRHIDLRRPVQLFPISYALLIAVGAIDYFTGNKISFSLFYLGPIILVAFYSNRRNGFIIALVGALIWMVVDMLGSSHSYIAPVLYWNSLIRLGFFMIIVLLIGQIKSLDTRLANFLQDTTVAWSKEVAGRSKALEYVPKSEVEFRSIISGLNNVYFILNSTGHFTYVSPILIKKSGYREEELIGMSYVRLIAAADRARIIRFYKEKVEAGDIEATCRFHVRTKGGELILVEQSTRIVRNEQNEVLEFHNIIRDIREEKKREEQLLLLAHAVASTSQMISITDVNNHFVFVNAAFIKTYGYTHDEVYGKTPELISSEKNDPSLVQVIEAETKRGGWSGELINKKKNGEEFRVALATTPIKNNDGEIVGLLGVATDVSEKYAAQEEIRRSEVQFRTVVETISQGLVQVSAAEVIEYVNNQFCAMTGYEREELVSKVRLEHFLREKDLEFFHEQMEKRKKGIGGLYEIQLKKKSGELFWGQIYASPILDVQGQYTGTIGVITDVTDRKKAEKMLLMAENKLQKLFRSNDEEPEEAIELAPHESQQMIEGLASRIDKTIRQMENVIKRVLSFSSMSSHELRTPLAIIRNQLEATMVSDLPVEQIQQNIAEVYDETLRLRSTVDQLLAIASMLSGTFRLELSPLNLQTFFQTFYEESLFLTRDKNIAINFTNVPQTTILANEFMLRRAMFNLLDNAIKFTPIGGTIHLHSSVEGRNVIIRFSDSGAGIASNELEHIFDAFWRGGNVDGVGGTGLGLTLVQLVVEAHNGTIHVHSEEGKGTTFVISLPVVEEQPTSVL
jgi:PAS domain S-box-containing protein